MLAYWIDPDNRYSEIRDNHIIAIITNPEVFGTSKKVVGDTYLKFNEKIGSEGEARRELIDAAISCGWIRIRLYSKTHCSITVAEVDERVRHTVTEFIQMLLSGQLDIGDVDKFMSVKLTTVKSGTSTKEYIMQEIASGILLNGTQSLRTLVHSD